MRLTSRIRAASRKLTEAPENWAAAASGRIVSERAAFRVLATWSGRAARRYSRDGSDATFWNGRIARVGGAEGGRDWCRIATKSIEARTKTAAAQREGAERRRRGVAAWIGGLDADASGIGSSVKGRGVGASMTMEGNAGALSTGTQMR